MGFIKVGEMVLDGEGESTGRELGWLGWGRGSAAVKVSQMMVVGCLR